MIDKSHRLWELRERTRHPDPTLEAMEPIPCLLGPETQEALRECSPCKEIIEIGSFIGGSAELIYRLNPEATILCIDPWLGQVKIEPEQVLSFDWRYPPATERSRDYQSAYDLFISNTFFMRDRVWPFRIDSLHGLANACEFHYHPDMIFIDGGHHYEHVWGDVRMSRRLFPEAILVFDDMNCPGVYAAAHDLLGDALKVNGNAAIFRP